MYFFLLGPSLWNSLPDSLLLLLLLATQDAIYSAVYTMPAICESSLLVPLGESRSAPGGCQIVGQAANLTFEFAYVGCYRPNIRPSPFVFLLSHNQTVTQHRDLTVFTILVVTFICLLAAGRTPGWRSHHHLSSAETPVVNSWLRNR